MIKLFKAFGFAFNGLVVFFKNETNGRIQGVCAVIASALAVYYNISTAEWIWLLGSICMVITLEMINSAIEKVCNMITNDFHPVVKAIKDMCAGAVLLASIFSFIIGCIIFLPKIFR
jgi:diacylglycerol kinase